MNSEQDPQAPKEKPKSGANIRLIVLVVILLIVGSGYLYDQYVLMPSVEERITKVTTEVTMSLTPENQKQVHDIVQMDPTEVTEYKGYEIEKYRFPRGLPFFEGRSLDIAYKGGAIAFFTLEPMTEEYIDSKMPDVSIKEGPRPKTISASPGTSP